LNVEIIFPPLEAGLAALLEYLSAHVLTCLIPAFFIAGAITALLKKDTVLKYFGADANKCVCYSIAATSGTVLAVCSCTILPMFAGIHRKGAGIGPAASFLFSGPAINVLAVLLTARVLGLDLGAARVAAAVSMAVVIGLVMAFIFERGGVSQKSAPQAPLIGADDENGRPSYISPIFLALLVGILLGATSGFAWQIKTSLVSALILVSAWMLKTYFLEEERSDFIGESWWLARKIFPLLLIGTFVTGVIGYFLPVDLIKQVFGTSNFAACFVAAMTGALLYMPTLLEVPIVGTLFGYTSGVMAPGPALSLLLAGPSMSLPNMIVIWRIIGAKKAGVYILLVVILSTLMGMIYGVVA